MIINYDLSELMDRQTWMDTWTNNGNFVGPICMGQKAMKKYLMQSLIKIAFNKYLCIIYIYIYLEM